MLEKMRLIPQRREMPLGKLKTVSWKTKSLETEMKNKTHLKADMHMK